MILMSKYKGQHGGKKGKKIRARPSPPPFRAMPERNRFILCEGFPKGKRGASLSLSISSQPGWKDAPIYATLVSRQFNIQCQSTELQYQKQLNIIVCNRASQPFQKKLHRKKSFFCRTISGRKLSLANFLCLMMPKVVLTHGERGTWKPAGIRGDLIVVLLLRQVSHKHVQSEHK